MAATVKLTNAVCETKNKTWITFDRCRLRAINRNKTVLNVDVNFLHPVHTADLNFRMQKKANGYKPWLGEYTVDFCAFMRKSNHPVIKILIGIFKDFSTLNHTCPYVGKQILKDFYWDPRDLTVPLPSGEYAVLLTWIFDKRPQFVTKVYFTFHQDIFKD
ncbi:uncharacterized protein LOC115762369 [Drosophila novamexicana]|uniref:uncharacterized protein LOC115762369 n=1 Tax=Drosophila novamexicana TaxID=47314 RepID=UPI0011E602D4|nr:uncharacterized protein LOC115762369 [Drosophila novamexicana]